MSQILPSGTLAPALDSGISPQGQKVGAVLDEPLFSADHKLILPEGTRVDGSVVFVKRAGWFHHTGRLRFNFQNLELPEVAGLLTPSPTAALSQGPLAEEKEKRLEVRTLYRKLHACALLFAQALGSLVVALSAPAMSGRFVIAVDLKEGEGLRGCEC